MSKKHTNLLHTSTLQCAYLFGSVQCRAGETMEEKYPGPQSAIKLSSNVQYKVLETTASIYDSHQACKICRLELSKLAENWHQRQHRHQLHSDQCILDLSKVLQEVKTRPIKTLSLTFLDSINYGAGQCWKTLSFMGVWRLAQFQVSKNPSSFENLFILLAGKSLSSIILEYHCWASFPHS